MGKGKVYLQCVRGSGGDFIFGVGGMQVCCWLTHSRNLHDFTNASTQTAYNSQLRLNPKFSFCQLDTHVRTIL